MSLTRNFMFSGLLTVAEYVFPLIVFPYATRVLGVDNLGICNYVDACVNFAMLLSLMGIVVVGTRSIAKTKGDPAKRDKTFTALFMLTAAFTVAATAVYLAFICAVPKLQPYRQLLLISIVKLWGNFLLIDWLYRGLEDFRYITVRSIIVKAAYIAAVFVFVRRQADYPVYFLLGCLMVACNAAFNCARALKIVSFKLDMKYVRRLAPPLLVLGVYIGLNSMYTTFNVMYLGFEHGDAEVGYYSVGAKIFRIILALYTAYSTVVVPRASALLSEGKHEEFRALIGQSVQGLLLFSIPAAVFTIVFCPGIVDLIAGTGYDGAVAPMMILMPLIFVIGYEQILVLQILIPHAHDNAILLNSCVGATVGVIGNLLLVSRLAAVGAAIVWLVAEVAVLCCAQVFVKKYTGLAFPLADFAKNVVAYAPYAAIAVCLARCPGLPPIGAMCIGAALLFPYFALIQKYWLRNPVYGIFWQKAGKLLRGRGAAANKE